MVTGFIPVPLQKGVTHSMASLKQAYQPETDTEDIEMVSDYTLFTLYNPKFIEKQREVLGKVLKHSMNVISHIWLAITLQEFSIMKV